MPAEKHTGDQPSPSPGVSTIQFPPTSRPTLGALESVSSPTNSVLPLTPPLTPSSTRQPDSDACNFGSNSLRIPTIYHYAHNFWPISQWNPSETFIPNRNISEYEHAIPERKISDSSILPSPRSPSRPKASDIYPARERESQFDTQLASHFLFISGIPKTATSQTLKHEFFGCGDLRGILVRFQAEHGIIILAFHDIRHTIRAHRQISTRTFFDHVDLTSRFISASELRKLIGQSNFVKSNEGNLFISTSLVDPEGELNAAALQHELASFGDLRSFQIMDTQATAFHVEYFDVRDAASALNELNGRVILGLRLHLTLDDSEVHAYEQTLFSRGAFSTSDSLSQTIGASPAGIPFPSIASQPALDHRVPDLSLNSTTHPGLRLRRSISELDLRTKAKQTQTKQTEQHTNTDVRGRRSSNIYNFDSVGKMILPNTPSRPRSISVSSESTSPVAGLLALPPCDVSLHDHLACYDAEQVEAGLSEAELASYEGAQATYSPEQCLMDTVPSPQPPVLQFQIPERVRHLPRLARRSGQGIKLMCDAPPERNRIDISRIASGDDTRTTVMIKNIPNKMSDRNLIEFINKVCPRKIDFLYLRMDFMNGCNVGYAFVNFIHVEDLLHFAETKLGTKWNMFFSEKILGMSYANYQGKEALLDKFRSSTVMEQRESWRPKLFHSSGPQKGLPEKFPVPILRRKERSNIFPSALQHTSALFHHPLALRG